jgi:TorA maturation chaperone TorD
MNKHLTTPSPIDRQETITGEMLLFNMLGRIFYTYPTPDERAWLQSLIDQDIFSEVPFAAENKLTKAGLKLLQNWAAQGLSDESFKTLQADYTRLFIGLGEGFAAPWESVYFSVDRLTFQEKTLEVRNWYRRFGLEAEKIHQEPDDHLGLELLFLSHLASLGLQALGEQDQARFDECWAAQREFTRQHLGAWALPWCSMVEANASTDFYKGLASLTSGAVSELSELLDIQLTRDFDR